MHIGRFLAIRVLPVALFTLAQAAPAGSDSRAPVATIGKMEISAQELDARTSIELKKQRDGYELSLSQLKLTYERKQQAYLDQQVNGLIDERVLDLEAAARKSTPDALTAAAAPAPVSDQQIAAFYEANKAQINQPFETVSAQIKEYLGKQAHDTARRNYLESLRTKYQAAALIEPFRDQVAVVGPRRGPGNAPVTLIEFSDFQCPFCGRLAPVIRDILKEISNPGAARLSPLSIV